MKRKLKLQDDYCKEVKKEKKTKKYTERRNYKKFRNNVNIPIVISKYKNPNSVLIPIENRKVVSISENINYEKFIDFNKCLDRIEEICKNKHKSIN